VVHLLGAAPPRQQMLMKQVMMPMMELRTTLTLTLTMMMTMTMMMVMVMVMCRSHSGQRYKSRRHLAML
jgi:hypothetical protein